jgi:hypothetical protein
MDQPRGEEKNNCCREVTATYSRWRTRTSTKIYTAVMKREVDTGVQLGFVSDSRNLMFIDSNWEKWDGGKVGGKPSWLDPIRIPHYADIQCKSCNSPMIFLLQIYCPLGEVERAFHRALYVFVCKRKVASTQAASNVSVVSWVEEMASTLTSQSL